LNREMEYTQFLMDIKERAESYFDGKVKGEICTSVKNNGVIVTGLMLKGENERVAPNFYLDQQFTDWMCGKLTLDDITERLCAAYLQEIRNNSTLLSKINFSWEEFRRSVFVRLVNKEKNEELLQTIPHREYLDLAMVFYYSVPISADVMGTLIITNEHLELLHITEDELYQTARNNCERFQPIKVRCMEDLLYDLGRKLGVDVYEARVCHPFLFVMTNEKSMFGAVALIFEEELEYFASRIQTGFYVLPSSVHELILVPECNNFNIEYFKSMVREINATQLDATEVLSDNIYYYDKEAKVLRVC